MGLAACILLAACGDSRPRTDVTTTKSTWHASPLEERLHWSAQASAVYPPTTTNQVLRRPKLGVQRGGCAGRSLEQIAMAESGGDYRAQNRRSTASGKYQELDSSWAGTGGFVHARDAPPEMQEAHARELYRIAGARPWDASW